LFTLAQAGTAAFVVVIADALVACLGKPACQRFCSAVLLFGLQNLCVWKKLEISWN